MKSKLIVRKINGRSVVILRRGSKNTYLPPIVLSDNKSLPRADFDLLGRAIAGDLGFSELKEQLSYINNKSLKKKSSVH